ncbi:GerMN domain-containing protein [Streptomyces sp. NRRL F-5630]|uniref:GerMN domain-containing protein n=1 Tax=Streptomyces sp. NRRL F-5630 TaxID=1463864 RepID=UPI003EBBD22D
MRPLRSPRALGRAALRRAALRRAALVLAAAGLLAGCGVPPTGVIEVGAPATGLRLTRGVYFLGRDDPGALRAVARPDGSGPGALRALLEGPSRTERGTLTTALPKDLPPPSLAVGAATLDLRFPEGTPPLSARASRQLACTALLNTPVRTAPTAPPRVPAAPGQAAALPAAPLATARVSVPGTPARLIDRAECPGLAD